MTGDCVDVRRPMSRRRRLDLSTHIRPTDVSLCGPVAASQSWRPATQPAGRAAKLPAGRTRLQPLISPEAHCCKRSSDVGWSTWIGWFLVGAGQWQWRRSSAPVNQTRNSVARARRSSLRDLISRCRTHGSKMLNGKVERVCAACVRVLQGQARKRRYPVGGGMGGK
jgi:hypothetical protein